MQVQFAAKRKKDEWKSALIVDQKFQDSDSSRNLDDLVTNAIGPVLTVDYPEGASVTVTVEVNIPPPGQPREGTRG